jgi:ribosomal protein L40E
MRSETYRETHRESANPPKHLNQTSHAGGLSAGGRAAVTRTRCPACRKLFAIETDTLMAMTRAGAYRAEFNCTSDFCRTAFAIPLPLPEGFDGVAVVPSIQLRPAEIETISPAQTKDSSGLKLELEFGNRPDIDFSDVEQKNEVEIHAKKEKQGADVSSQVQAVLASVATEKECPRCNAKNAVSLKECVRCGIIFDRYDSGEIGTKADLRIEEEMALGGARELSALWDRLIEDYEDRVRHDRFVNACRDAKALSYAAKKYSQILVSAPQDEVARLMRNRIVALVSAQAETSKIPIRLDFRIPSMNTMALAMGSILFFWGLMMPQLKNIMEIGLSMVLLSIGVRLALRARV